MNTVVDYGWGPQISDDISIADSVAGTDHLSEVPDFVALNVMKSTFDTYHNKDGTVAGYSASQNFIESEVGIPDKEKRWLGLELMLTPSPGTTEIGAFLESDKGGLGSFGGGLHGSLVSMGGSLKLRFDELNILVYGDVSALSAGVYGEGGVFDIQEDGSYHIAHVSGDVALIFGFGVDIDIYFKNRDK